MDEIFVMDIFHPADHLQHAKLPKNNTNKLVILNNNNCMQFLLHSMIRPTYDDPMTTISVSLHMARKIFIYLHTFSYI